MTSRVLFTATAATAAVLASAGAAAAAPAADAAPQGPDPIGSTLTGVTDTLRWVTDTAATTVAPALGLELYPLSRTPVNPLDNSAGAQVADFQPVSSALLTGALSDGISGQELLGGLPLSPG